MSNLHLVNSHHSDGLISLNETVFNHNLTVNVNMSAIVAGPVTIPTLVVNGNLNVVDSLTVSTGNLTIAGHLRIS